MVHWSTKFTAFFTDNYNHNQLSKLVADDFHSYIWLSTTFFPFHFTMAPHTNKLTWLLLPD